MMSMQTYWDNIDRFNDEEEKILGELSSTDDVARKKELNDSHLRLISRRLAFEAEYGRMFSRA